MRVDADYHEHREQGRRYLGSGQVDLVAPGPLARVRLRDAERPRDCAFGPFLLGRSSSDWLAWASVLSLEAHWTRPLASSRVSLESRFGSSKRPHVIRLPP